MSKDTWGVEVKLYNAESEAEIPMGWCENLTEGEARRLANLCSEHLSDYIADHSG